MFRRIIQPVIRQVLMNFLTHRLSGNQRFDFPFHHAIAHFFNEMSDRIVAAGIRPVILRRQGPLHLKPVHIIDHIPGAIQPRFSKQVSVIPFPDLVIFIGQLIGDEHFLYFLIRKTKAGITVIIHDGKYFGIIQSRKNTFLRHSETSR